MVSLRTTTIPGRLSLMLFWLAGISHMFYAVVVYDRSGFGEVRRTTAQLLASTSWRLYAGALYGVTMLLLAFAIIMIVATGRCKGSPRRGGLVAAFLMMYACPLISGALGGHGGLDDWRLWLPLPLLFACHLALPMDLERLLRMVRVMLRIYVWGSLAAYVLLPSWAVLPSLIDNFSLEWLTPGGRLAGMTSYPISLGLLSALALVVECVPLHRTRWWQLHSAASTSTLLLSQSRTAWVAAAAALLFLYKRDRIHKVDPPKVHPMLGRVLVGGAVACMALLVPAVQQQLAVLGESREITTVHGRTLAWDASIKGFETNIWLGYGPSFYSDIASPGHWAFDHAHDQLLQTLATAGLLGATALLALVVAVTVYSVRTARATAGLTPSLTVLMLVVCVPSVPLKGDGFSPYLLLVLVLFGMLHSASHDGGAPDSRTPVSSARSGNHLPGTMQGLRI